MANSVTMSVYLGARQDGLKIEEMIAAAARKRNMNKSEFALYSMLEQLKREEQNETK